MQPHPWARTASRMVKVPTTLVCRNGSGSASALSTWVSAAKCTTASASATSRDTNSASVDIALHQADVVLDRRQTTRDYLHRSSHPAPSPHGRGTATVHEIGADKPRATGHQQPHPQTTAILLFDFNLKRLADGLADGGWTTRANSPAAAPATPDQYHKDPCPHESDKPAKGCQKRHHRQQ